MSKKSIIIILLLLVVSSAIISLYATFAYNEESNKLDDSEADYNLIYSLKESSDRQISIAPNEEKFVDIVLTNIYKSTIRYGMYYQLIKPNEEPAGLKISLAKESIDSLENTMKPSQTRTISLQVKNDSNDNIDLIIGALIGFENGNINDLVKNNEVLIK